MITIDMSLKNTDLYAGCQIEEAGGRLNLTTPVAEATNIVGKNALKIIGTRPMNEDITLTGPMAVWAYMIVFHCVVHSFRKVYYDDGRSGPVLIAAHG